MLRGIDRTRSRRDGDTGPIIPCGSAGTRRSAPSGALVPSPIAPVAGAWIDILISWALRSSWLLLINCHTSPTNPPARRVRVHWRSIQMQVACSQSVEGPFKLHVDEGP